MRRGFKHRRQMLPPLTPTLSPQAGRGDIGGTHDPYRIPAENGRAADGQGGHRDTGRLPRRLARVRQHREGRPVVVRDPGHAGELRGGQGRPARHVRRYRRAALVRQDRQRGAQRGRADRAGGRSAPRHRQCHARRAAAAQPRASALAHGPQQQLRHRRAGDRIFVSPGCRLDRVDHRAQGRAVRLRLSHAVSRRRHRRHQAVLSRHADPVRPARACLPAGYRRRGARRLQGHLHGARQAGLVPAHGRLAQSRSQDRGAGRGAERHRQQHRHGRHGLHGHRPWWSIATSRSATATPAACR